MTAKDRFLLVLVRNYRHGDPKRGIHVDWFARSSGSDYQELENIAAELKSEGSIVHVPISRLYRLTDSGYARYRARAEAIEALA